MFKEIMEALFGTLMLAIIMLLCLELVFGGCGMVPKSGAPGPVGPQGATPATPPPAIVMVQLCPGVTPTYPITFPEWGECVQDRLYAVYWDNKNAWLSEIPPGVYYSTSTSAPCTFTVGDKCTLSW